MSDWNNPVAHATRLATLLILLAAGAELCAAPDKNPPADEPPLVGQPEHFCGAVGVFKAAAEALPTELHAGGALTYILRLTSSGPAGQPPQRPDLRRLTKFKKRFQIHDLATADRTEAVPGGKQWEFHYRLRPLKPEVNEIPALRLDYYKPGSIPSYKGYRATYTQSIPLRVLFAAPEAEARPAAPEWMQRLVEGESVLGFEEPPAVPGLAVLALLFVLPLVGCGIWYLAWRRLYPDAAAAARRQRSRAARLALAALHADGQPDADARTKHTAQIVQGYLRQRLDISEAVPEAVADRLQRAGYSAELAEQVADFFHNCDAARFATGLVPAADKLPAAAENLILALESKP